MKKLNITVLLALLCVVLLAVPVLAAGQEQVAVNLYVNGIRVDFPDQRPYIDGNNRTLVPVRFPSETLGAEVDWNFDNQAAREVYIDQQAHDVLPEAHLVVTIDSEAILVNGKIKLMDTTAILTNDRTMVPVRFISEYLGAEVRWDGPVRAAHVFTEGQSEEEMQEIIDDVYEDIAGEVRGAPPYPTPRYEVEPVEGVTHETAEYEGYCALIDIWYPHTDEKIDNAVEILGSYVNDDELLTEVRKLLKEYSKYPDKGTYQIFETELYYLNVNYAPGYHSSEIQIYDEKFRQGLYD